MSVGLFLLLWNSALAAPTGKIGYGSSNSVISVTYEENVLLGYELGLEHTLGKRAKDKELTVIQLVNDKSLQAATTSAERLVEQGAVALVGFPVSHDALLAADVARKHGLLAVFGGASHTELANRGPLVYSTGASMETLLDNLLDFLHGTFGARKGWALISPYFVFSAAQEELFNKKLPRWKGRVRLSIRRLAEGYVLSDADLLELKKGKAEYLYVTLYPDDLVALLSQLETARIDLPIVAFGGPDPAILRRFVSQKKAPYYIGDNWVPPRSQTRFLQKIVRKRFRKELNSEMILGYNLGQVVGQTVLRIKGPITRESVIAAFRSKPCFQVLGIEALCFGPSGGHAERHNVRFVRFSQAQPLGKKAP